MHCTATAGSRFAQKRMQCANGVLGLPKEATQQLALGLALTRRRRLAVCIAMRPVSTADGFVYERAAISRWLETKATSPMTGAHLGAKDLFPRLALREKIQVTLNLR